ncbi:MAG TPA: pyridoxamine 5'-phosphate oxidase family protein [Jiangellales bacterium]|nr:pyridoxamine 5'-phosphate oxidase family protein [Jiangellales bacterium]
MSTDVLPLTERTRVGRLRERQVRDRSQLDAILDAGLVAHVAVCRGRVPLLLPMAYARDGERLVLHGSTGAGLLRAVASGAQVAVAVTHLDGVVYARTAFESSMNYRSVVVYGTATVLEGDEKFEALRVLTEHLMPGRWDEVRPPTRQELAATLVLAVPLDEASVKVRAGGPSDELADDPGAWAGVLPLRTSVGVPVPAEDLDAHTPLPPSVLTAMARSADPGRDD